MIKKIYLPLMLLMTLAFVGCNKDMKPLSADYFTVTPSPLEVVGGQVPATVTGTFPEKYFDKKSVVTVTPYLVYADGETAGTPFVYQEGLRAVQIFKERFPDKEVLADMKIMDDGYYEAE